MGKFIFGFVLGYILSDVIINKVPSASKFKVSPKSLENLFPPMEVGQQVKGLDFPRLLVRY
jgi:hypothetical protein